MSYQEAPHSMCVSLRMDSSTLKSIEQDLDGATLSAGLGTAINSTLKRLAANAKETK